MIHWKYGNLLEADVQYICHQVNCQGHMGAGIAKAIRDKWSNVYQIYKHFCGYHSQYGPEKYLLGSCQFVDVEPNKIVINMFAQNGYGKDGRRYTSYDAFWMCLGEIKKTVPKGSTIGFPWKIGCGLGGANWQVISTMIAEVLAADYEIYIYQLEE